VLSCCCSSRRSVERQQQRVAVSQPCGRHHSGSQRTHCALPSPPRCSTWYESTKHGPNFRNVKDYGAKGDGITDDSNVSCKCFLSCGHPLSLQYSHALSALSWCTLQAIIAALTTGRTPAFSTSDPTVVYLPPGTYIVSQTVSRRLAGQDARRPLARRLWPPCPYCMRVPACLPLRPPLRLQLPLYFYTFLKGALPGTAATTCFVPAAVGPHPSNSSIHPSTARAWHGCRQFQLPAHHSAGDGRVRQQPWLHHRLRYRRRGQRACVTQAKGQGQGAGQHDRAHTVRA